MKKNIVFVVFAMLLFLSGCMFIAKEDKKVNTLGMRKNQDDAQTVLKIIDEQKPAEK